MSAVPSERSIIFIQLHAPQMDYGSCWLFPSTGPNPVTAQQSSSKLCSFLLSEWGSPISSSVIPSEEAKARASGEGEKGGESLREKEKRRNKPSTQRKGRKSKQRHNL